MRQQQLQRHQYHQKQEDPLRFFWILLLMCAFLGSTWFYVLPYITSPGQANSILQHLNANTVNGIKQSDVENLLRLGYDRETTIQILLAGISTSLPKVDIESQLADLQSRINEDQRNLSLAEKRTAYLISREGKLVMSLAETGPGRQADIMVDGVRTELKALIPGATSNTIVSRVQASIKGGGQARHIIFDARGSGLSQTEAERSFRRLKGGSSGGLTKGRVDSIRIIADDFDRTETGFP